MKIGIVLLYGLYLSERQDYKEYLDFIAREIQENNFDKVILCGGFTNPDRPDDSEASTAEKYLQTRIDYKRFVLEDRSINTNQNIEFAAKRLIQLDITEDDEIIVYGDLIRKSKIAWLAMHEILGLSQKKIYKFMLDYIHLRDIYKDIEYENLIVKGFDFPDKTKEEIIGMSYTAILDVLAAYDPELEELDLQKRREYFGLN